MPSPAGPYMGEKPAWWGLCMGGEAAYICWCLGAYGSLEGNGAGDVAGPPWYMVIAGCEAEGGMDDGAGKGW